MIPVFIPGHFSVKSTLIDEMMTDSLVKLYERNLQSS